MIEFQTPLLAKLTTFLGTESALLDRYANNLAIAGQRAYARNKWYGLRSALQPLTSLPRLRACGRVPRSTAVGVRSTGGKAGYSGLVTCGSVWSCPVCSRKIGARRAVDVGGVVAQAISEGYTVVFVTKTLRHHAGQSLSMLWDSVSTCWHSVVNTRWYRFMKIDTGLIGFIRSAEVTHGENGWHPHTHVVLILRGDISDVELADFVAGIDKRWAAKAVSLGLLSPLAAGQHYRRVGAGDIAEISSYMSKTHKDAPLDAGRIGLELTFTQSKTARAIHSTRSMWEVLEGALRGEVTDVALWQIWERVSKGRRALSWSKGLRERFQLDVEQTDEEIADEEIGTVEDTLVWITNAGWLALVREQPELIPEILNITESGGFPALAALLDAHGIPWTPA